MTMDGRNRWFALIVLCMGSLMIVLDTTIVNVALPSIRADLGFSQTSLAWVVNAYLLTFGGFLLLGGRFGDLFGHRRLFLSGITLFTLASLVCGLATSQAMLVGARAVQGLGGAVASAVALSLMMTLFTEPAERASASCSAASSRTSSTGTGSSSSTCRSESPSSPSRCGFCPRPASPARDASMSPAPSR
jgi:MFS family permease